METSSAMSVMCRAYFRQQQADQIVHCLVRKQISCRPYCKPQLPMRPAISYCRPGPLCTLPLQPCKQVSACLAVGSVSWSSNPALTTSKIETNSSVSLQFETNSNGRNARLLALKGVFNLLDQMHGLASDPLAAAPCQRRPRLSQVLVLMSLLIEGA